MEDINNISMSSEYNSEVIRRISSRERLIDLIQCLTGPLIIKFGASWCRPCRVIADDVVREFNNAPDSWVCCDLDVDENDDIYAFYKKNKQVSGIPALLCIMPGAYNGIPEITFSGTNKSDLAMFFDNIRRLNSNIHN